MRLLPELLAVVMICSVAALKGSAGALSLAFRTSHPKALSSLASFSTSSSSSSSPSSSGGRRSYPGLSTNQSSSSSSSSSSPPSNPAPLQDKVDTNPPRGTRDFLPASHRLRSWLFSLQRASSSRFSFEEVDAPVLENSSLYTRKAGEDISHQLYSFEDKGGRKVCLRPEMTPSIARMVLGAGSAVTMPIKWFSIPQCWRYERMTRGRRREHYQWNMDIWGVESVAAEAELIGAMVDFFKSVGLTSKDVVVKISTRGVIAEVLKGMSVPESNFASICVLVDKLDKVSAEELKGEFTSLGLTEDSLSKLLAVTKNKDLPSLEHVLGSTSPSVMQLKELLQLLSSYGLGDWVQVDACVVRGLSYYTGVVFEAVDRAGSFRAIAGGGRYDNLIESYGGEPTPAVGFGLGDAVITELLRERGAIPNFDVGGVDALVYPMDEELRGEAMKIAADIRVAGEQSVDLILNKGKKPKWAFKHADRVGARFVIVLGTDEWKNGEVSVKRLDNGEQRKVPVAEIAKWLREAK